jgi:hypothetical protein
VAKHDLKYLQQFFWDSGRIKAALSNTTAVAVAFLSGCEASRIIETIKRSHLGQVQPRSAYAVSGDAPGKLHREPSQHGEVFLTDKQTLPAKVMWTPAKSRPRTPCNQVARETSI